MLSFLKVPESCLYVTKNMAKCMVLLAKRCGETFEGEKESVPEPVHYQIIVGAKDVGKTSALKLLALWYISKLSCRVCTLNKIVKLDHTQLDPTQPIRDPATNQPYTTHVVLHLLSPDIPIFIVFTKVCSACLGKADGGDNVNDDNVKEDQVNIESGAIQIRTGSELLSCVGIKNRIM